MASQAVGTLATCPVKVHVYLYSESKHSNGITLWYLIGLNNLVTHVKSLELRVFTSLCTLCITTIEKIRAAPRRAERRPKNIVNGVVSPHMVLLLAVPAIMKGERVCFPL